MMCRSRRDKAQGFTLIELLVVMVIMMTVLGLVGGVVVNAADKAKQRSEYLTLQALVEHLAQQSLRQNRKYYVLAEGNDVWFSTENLISYLLSDDSNYRPSANEQQNQWYVTEEVRAQIGQVARNTHLNLLYFDEVQLVEISRNGFSLSKPLKVVYGNNYREIVLPTLEYEDESGYEKE